MSHPNASRPRKPSPLRVGLAVALAWLHTTGPARAGDEVALSSCPEAVQSVIFSNLQDGKIDEIKRIEVEDRVLFIVEVDRKAAKDLKLHISGIGDLLKTVEEVRLRDLPEPVLSAIASLTTNGGRASDVDRVVIDGRVEYHVEVKRPKGPKLRFAFDEAGLLLGQK